MVVHLATDHAGFTHKEEIRVWLEKEGFAVLDHGAHHLDPLDDFPDFIARAAQAISRKPAEDRAVIFGGSGQGEAMAANRFPNVRATVLYSDTEEIPVLGRQHNDSNVLSIGARFVSAADAKKHIWNWLHTEPLEDEKYHRRNKKLEGITKQIES